MNLLYVKALHIIFVVCWFAGLFYMVRLFIYTHEAFQKEEPAKSILTTQLLTMQKKLWFIITWPSLVGTYIFGWWMIGSNVTYYLSQPWMWLKLIFVGMLTLYHLQCHIIHKQQKRGLYKNTSFKLRLFNELGTVFLVAIVFLVVVKSTGSFVWGLLGLFIFAALLMGGVYIYKKQRQSDGEQNSPTNLNNTTPPEIKS